MDWVEQKKAHKKLSYLKSLIQQKHNICNGLSSQIKDIRIEIDELQREANAVEAELTNLTEPEVIVPKGKDLGDDDE